MSDYERGFRAGVEAAAKEADDHRRAHSKHSDGWWACDGIAKRIRALAPAPPESPRCPTCKKEYPTQYAAECCPCWGAAPPEETTRSDAMTGTHEIGGRESRRFVKEPPPASARDACDHIHQDVTTDDLTVLYARCRDCGAYWHNDGLGWRSGTGVAPGRGEGA